jgi:tetratricopeptide (TPR) repeat protein
MKINRKPLPTLPEEAMQKDHEFWSQFSGRLIGNWITYDTSVKDIVDFVEKVYQRHDFTGFKGDRAFVRDDQGQKAFSKLRSSIGGVYAWRLSQQCPPEYRPKTGEEFQRIAKEADFTFRQAFAFCPYSPEAVFRYVNLLLQFNRIDDALLVAQTCLKLDPANDSARDLVRRLHEFKGNSAQVEKARTQLQTLEEEVRKNPTNFHAAFDLASSYMQMQQPELADRLLKQILDNPAADANVVMSVFRGYVQMGKWDRIEYALERMTNVMSAEPEVWFDLAAIKASLGKPDESIKVLAQAINLSAQRRATNPEAKDLQTEAKTDPRFNSVKSMPEFQKLVTP